MKPTRSLCASLFFAFPITFALFLLSSCSSGSTSTPAGDTFSLTIQIAPTDTANLMLFVQPEGSYTDDVPTMSYNGQDFTAQCPSSPAHFYSITCLKDGGQYLMPLWSPSGSLTIALLFADGAPTGFAPVKGLTPKSETAAIKVMSDYYRLSTDIQRTFWMQMRETDEPTLQDYISQLARCADDGCKAKAVNKEVKDYLTAWAYLDGHKMIDSYNRMHEPKADPISLLHKSPIEALDNEIALLQNGAALTAYSAVPKGDLDTRIKFVREQFKTSAIQTTLEKMILDNYLRRYDFNTGVEQGLKELTSAQQTYGIDSTYIEKFCQRMSSAIGAPFPEVIIEDRDGTPVDINAFRGKYLYIDLWASWCVPCVKEVPHLQALEKELKNDKVAFLSISCDTDRNAWLQKMDDLHMHGNQFIDVKGEFCDRLGVTGIPRFLIYDPKGHLLVADAPRPSSPAAREMLEKL